MLDSQPHIVNQVSVRIEKRSMNLLISSEDASTEPEPFEQVHPTIRRVCYPKEIANAF